jgi:signal transduction histidine kinase
VNHKLADIFKPEDEKDKVVISVIDNGLGIKKKDRLKMFKLFGKL